MVYALRNRDPAPSRSTGSKSTSTSEKKKQTTQKKTSASRRKSVDIPVANKQDGGLNIPIHAEDSHKKHMLDGKEHHVVEQDGLDHHHIWYKDFTGGTPVANKQDGGMNIPILTEDSHKKHMLDGKDHHVVEQDGLDHHHIWYKDFAAGHKTSGAHHHGTEASHTEVPAPGPQSRARRSSVNDSDRHSTSHATPVEKPLIIHVDHSKRRHSVDGTDHHNIEADGRDHHHIRYGDSSASTHAAAHKAHKASVDSNAASTSHAHLEASDPGHDLRDRHHIVVGHDLLASHPHSEPAAAHHVDHHQDHASETHSSNTKMDHGKTIHTETTKTHTPLHGVGSTRVSNVGHGQHAITRHHEGTDTVMTTATTTTKVPTEQTHHSRLHTKDEAVVRLLTQKSQLDRAKTLDAIMSLDGDVIQLQKLLHDKELALHKAESHSAEVQHQTIVKTETLTHEVHELETMIRDLRSHLKEKESALKQSHHQVHQLTTENKKEHEHAEQQSHKVQKDLALANSQREKLAHHVHELTKALHEREHALKATQLTVKGLEKTSALHSKEAQKLNHELIAMKKGMADRQAEIKECHSQIKALEGEHTKVEALGGQLRTLRAHLLERENSLKEVEKANKDLNKDLNKDHSKATQLSNEVNALKHDIQEREAHLKKAQKAVDNLGAFRDRAATLEVEVHDLRDQVNMHEKHESDLEDALMEHEKCSFQSQELQGEINLLQARLNEKQGEIHNLQNSNETLAHNDQNRINSLQGEVQILLGEMAAKELAAQKLKEKAASSSQKMTAQIETLRGQLSAKENELKAADKTAKELEAMSKENSKGLKDDIKSLEARLNALQGQLQTKEAALQQTLQNSNKDHENGVHRIEEMRILVAELRAQMKDAEKEAHQQVRAKEDQIKALQNQLAGVEKNDQAKIDELNHEIRKETALLHEKEKIISEIQRKMTEQTIEIVRLNTAVQQARGELAQDRKRRASEIQETVHAQTSQFQQTKNQLEHQISDLQHANEAQVAKAQQTKSQLEHQISDLQHANQAQLTKVQQEKTKVQYAKAQTEHEIAEVKDQNAKLQQGFLLLETGLKQETTTTKELTDMLSHLRKSMKSDSEAEIKKLDQLEQQIKNRASVVTETIQVSRSRMDSGAFLDQSQQQQQQAQH